jgi:poly(3-hydroxybutyrate) depolymerase
MRRVWILLLVMMLPLQTAWAAVHGYAHDADVAAHARVESQMKVDVAGAADTVVDHQTEADGHGCCDMAHSCHGSATLMPTLVIQLGAEARSLLNASDGAFTLQMLVTRHDRPNWVPA